MAVQFRRHLSKGYMKKLLLLMLAIAFTMSAQTPPTITSQDVTNANNKLAADVLNLLSDGALADQTAHAYNDQNVTAIQTAETTDAANITSLQTTVGAVQTNVTALQTAEATDANNIKNIQNTPTSKPSFTLSSGIYGMVASAGMTLYETVGGYTALSTTEASRKTAWPLGCTAQGMYVTTTTTNAAQTVITLRQNGIATPLLVSVPGAAAAGVYSDITDQVLLNAGDLVDYQIVQGQGTGANIIAISFRCAF